RRGPGVRRPRGPAARRPGGRRRYGRPGPGRCRGPYAAGRRTRRQRDRAGRAARGHRVRVARRPGRADLHRLRRGRPGAAGDPPPRVRHRDHRGRPGGRVPRADRRRPGEVMIFRYLLIEVRLVLRNARFTIFTLATPAVLFLVFAALGVLIGQFATQDSIQPIMTALMMVLGLAGGMWIPAQVVPGWMRHVMEATPTYWLREVGQSAFSPAASLRTAVLVLGGYAL